MRPWIAPTKEKPDSAETMVVGPLAHGDDAVILEGVGRVR
jgi:hypothetical protein